MVNVISNAGHIELFQDYDDISYFSVDVCLTIESLKSIREWSHFKISLESTTSCVFFRDQVIYFFIDRSSC